MGTECGQFSLGGKADKRARQQGLMRLRWDLKVVLDCEIYGWFFYAAVDIRHNSVGSNYIKYESGNNPSMLLELRVVISLGKG